MPFFKVHSEYEPAGDQPQAIAALSQGVENGLRAELSVKNTDVNITGAQLWVETLKANALTLVCDASGLAEGTYQLPVICQVEGSDGQTFSVEVVPETIAVTISSK